MRLVTFCFILLCGLLCNADVSVKQPITKNILLVIGYADENEIQKVADLFQHKYYYGLSQWTEAKTTEMLELNGFTEVSKNPAVFENKNHQVCFTILNANVLCPNEKSTKAIRTNPCLEQLQMSQSLVYTLQTKLMAYDEFIYIGHSRLGLGLGLGPFIPEYTFDSFKFYNQSEAGQLKKVLMLSCNSNSYYKNKIASRTNIIFDGVDGDQNWNEQLLPKLIQEINTL